MLQYGSLVFNFNDGAFTYIYLLYYNILFYIGSACEPCCQYDLMMMIYHHYEVILTAWIFFIFSCHPSLSSILPGWSSGLHSKSAQT